MISAHATAPSYKQLRPLKETSSSTFPVYRGLSDHLVEKATYPDPTVRHVLGTCAGYAYSDEQTVAMIMARMGLEENRCLKIAESVDAMFICSTSFLIQSQCGRVAILCYRGTTPADFINWLTDADVNPEKVAFHLPNAKAPFHIHAGFYRNVRATRYAIITALQRALEGRSIIPDQPDPKNRLEALYVTGHSLGAAMAALMAIMLSTEPAYGQIGAKLKAVYTFGQPMIGDPSLAKVCNEHPFLGQKVFRYIYAHDVVAALPPTASGDFAHFGAEYQFVIDKGDVGDWHRNDEPMKQVSNPLDLPLAGFAFVAHQLRRFRKVTFLHSMDDHGPQHYIAALAPPGVRTEFGD
jgi:hypothetical protein